MGLIPGDSSAPQRVSNRIAVQAMMDSDNSVFIPAGDYYFDDGSGLDAVLTIRRSAIVKGEGRRTALFFPEGCIALKFQFNNVGNAPGDGQYSILEDIWIRGSGLSPQYEDRVAPNRDHGVLLQAAGVWCRNVHVTNFGGDAWRMDAGTGIPPGFVTNANITRLSFCGAYQSGGKGFNVHDGDNNSACLLDHCQALGNAAGDWAEQSFLGNTIVGGGAHSERAPNKIVIGDVGGSSAHTTVVGLYNEGPELAQVNAPAIMLGGTAAFSALRNPESTGLILSGLGGRNIRSVLYTHSIKPYIEGESLKLGALRRPSRPTLANGRKYKVIDIGNAPHQCGAEPNPYPMTYGGGEPSPGATFVSGDITFQEDTVTDTEIDSSAYLDHPTGDTALYHALMKAEDNEVQGWIWGAHVIGLFPGWWVHGYGDDLTQGAIAISTVSNNDLHEYTGRGTTWVPKLKIGNWKRYGMRAPFLDTEESTPDSGSRHRGDYRICGAPRPGGVSAWRCTQAGAPGIWHEVPLPGTYRTRTTTRVANQVVATHLIIPQATSVLRVTVAGNKTNTDEGVGAIFEIVVKRNASGHPIFIGGTGGTIRKTDGLEIDGLTGIHIEINDNSDSIEVQVDPGEDVILNWTIRVDATESVSL